MCRPYPASPRVSSAVALLSLAAAASLLSARAQPIPPRPLPDVSQTADGSAPHRTRLILKDGTYQLVMSYARTGDTVTYVSAERGSAEEIPASLVDWDATHRWERSHAAAPDSAAPASAAPGVVDPELEKEEQDRRSLTPEVAPDLSLPDQDSALALDYYQGTPELVPLVQTEGDLNRTTSHNRLRLSINPRSAPHEILTIPGIEANVQMHVAQPVFYLRVGEDAVVSHGGAPFVVDTHGAAAGPADSPRDAAQSEYVILRADVRTDARLLASFNIGALGGTHPVGDVVETDAELLPGGHWLKLTPRRPLDFGEYALMEVMSDRDVNRSVWDFGVHPVAPENRDVIKPQPRRKPGLERR